MGCCAAGRMLKNSRAAAPSVACAGVKTSAEGTGDASVPPIHAHAPAVTAESKTRAKVPRRTMPGYRFPVPMLRR